MFLQGYTNEDNPFGDPNLLDTFVWVKVSLIFSYHYLLINQFLCNTDELHLTVRQDK